MIPRKIDYPDLAIFTPTLDGGVGRVIFNLVEELSQRHKIDVIVTKLTPDSYKLSRANVIELSIPRTFKSLPKLISYLRKSKPPVMMSVIYHANIVAVLAKLLSFSKTRLIASEHIAINQALAQESPRLRQILTVLIKFCYPKVEKIITVSHGAAAELASLGIPANKILTIYNPVISPGMLAQANQPVDHLWLTNKTEPVIIGMGRLTYQKDFKTLIDAFLLVRLQTPCKLLILGDGPDRLTLNEQIRQLGLKNHVQLLGQITNPYPYLKHSDLFVLSSRHEGLPTVLIEALALGLKIVSTDCPHGPKEILQNGKFGSLVPIGNPETLAVAILEQLHAPPTIFSELAIEPFLQKTSARLYEQLFFRS